MSKKSGKSALSNIPAASNDNNNPQSENGEKPANCSTSKGKWHPKVYTDMPHRFPVMEAEVYLIEAYLSDLIVGIIANDNEPSE